MNNPSGLLGNLGTANINVQFDVPSSLKLGATALGAGTLLILISIFLKKWLNN